MVKSVIKEIFIILLLSIAILLILGIIFYDYIPINRFIPEKEAYTMPDNIMEEINETILETEKVEVTYEVTDSDLNIYKQTGSYTEGKENPFTLKETNETMNSKSNTGTEAEIEDNTNDNRGTTVDENSTGTFFNDAGIE